MRAFAGRLGSSAQTLADALETMTRLDKEIARLYVYASMLSDQDTRLSEPQGMQQEMQQLAAEFSAQASYMQPEILRLGRRDDRSSSSPRSRACGPTRSRCATSSGARRTR